MKRKVNKSALVRKLLKINPNITADEVAKRAKLTKAIAHTYIWKAKKDLKPKKVSLTATQVHIANELGIDTATYAKELYKVSQGRKHVRSATALVSDSPVSDNVNHPAHYKQGGIETIDFIEAKNLSYHLGNVVKYITRADHKGNKLEDLKKAQWYLNRAIEKLNG